MAEPITWKQFVETAGAAGVVDDTVISVIDFVEVYDVKDLSFAVHDWDANGRKVLHITEN